MIPILAFDIETIPDIAAIKTLYTLPEDLSDSDVAEFAMQQRRAQTGGDFMPHHLHKIVAISCCIRTNDGIKIGTLGRKAISESEIIHNFFNLIQKYTPKLVSWNGGGFDLPVLNYRAMIHGVPAARYWDMGEGDFRDSHDFKFNNYISRYHSRHTDLMDLLAMYTGRANAPLDQMAKLCGFPGKLGMDGAHVWTAYQAGKINEICDYCETDVANTYLLFLRFQLISGAISPETYEHEIEKMQEYLSTLADQHAHWAEFLDEWFANGLQAA